MARGRPRKIDTKDALHSVMIAFWQNGYTGTSMSDLADASGMAKPGLYAAFGDKEALFEKALLHYFETYGGPVFARLKRAEKHVVQDFRDFLGAVADLTLDKETPAGCFLVNALVDCTYGAQRHQEVVLNLRAARFKAIRDRLLKAVAAGEMSEDTDVDRTATFIDGQFSAIALLGRSGSSENDLRTFIETGLQALPASNDLQEISEAAFNSPILRQ
ncbi:TetR family transcriptional regulator [Labrenzia sp. C1B10]|uniref:TetR/AcrR family transcriptional regulator n=1 Tax=unclassified Labrenzia TaxID=2648686 RepID=UPI0003B8757D|nr:MULTISPECIES: TetR/AcrR family transcriptional regulator [unclassified Labrenzia]ERP85900.1 TetR family transcriptional regulator [Labrenzia sp. C1B10]ERS06187.1 TetR family transcriptional regulator [Labrenzia sp. C1B70]